jgi:DNA helicase II / ATP-dependent DNA helicase PcrA
VADYDPTPEQEAILAHPADQHGRVLAGPGTGKSATVVAWITRLLDEEDAPRIRLLTFTRAATAELAEKVADHPRATVERPSTIHSFAIAALLRNPGSGDFPEPLRVADEWEMDKLIRPQLAAMTDVTPSFVKKRLIPEMAANWESLEGHPDPEVSEEVRNRFLGAWTQHRRIYGYTLLAELPDLLRRAIETYDDLEGLDYDLLVVDEYQDLNACDLRVLRLLAESGTMVMGVGDDEQSIYAFRKAAPEGILRFLEDYPGAGDYPLTVSHRCGEDIIAWARYVIEGDPSRDPDRERLQPASGAPSGECALLSFRSAIGEARGIASLVGHLVNDEGVPPAEILVLFRGDHNGVFSGPVKEELAKMDIDVFDPSWVDEVLNEDTNRIAVLLLRLLANDRDSLAWAGLLKLTQGVGDSFLWAIYNQAVDDNSTFAEALIAAYEDELPDVPAVSRTPGLERVRQTLEWLGRHEVPEELEGGWGEWIIEAFADDAPVGLSGDLSDLFLSVDDVVEEGTTLGRYMGLVQPLAKDQLQSRAGGVRFMSMTSSKGLTVTATIVGGAEDGLIPRPDADIAEERRLMYVAMTRARRYQYVTWATRRTGPTARAGRPVVQERRQVSRFLAHGPVPSQDGELFLKERW